MLDHIRIRNSLSRNNLISSVIYYEEIDSTNDFAKHFEGNSDILVCADFQKKGKGRFDRKWESQKGKNLTISIRKSIPISPSENQYVNFFFTYYLFETVVEILRSSNFGFISHDFHIKWPNDLLYKEQKTAGLLIESLPFSNKYVIGIGLNVNQGKFEFLNDATSLGKITGTEFDLSEICIRLIQKYSANYFMLAESKFPQIFDIWLNSTRMIGKQCEFTDTDNKIKRGIINNLNSDGSIEILFESGKRKFFSGEIRLTSF